jgi:hypothetical protein
MPGLGDLEGFAERPRSELSRNVSQLGTRFSREPNERQKSETCQAENAGSDKLESTTARHPPRARGRGRRSATISLRQTEHNLPVVKLGCGGMRSTFLVKLIGEPPGDEPDLLNRSAAVVGLEDNCLDFRTLVGIELAEHESG